MSLKRKQMCEVLPFADASDLDLAAFYKKRPEYTIAALQICVADEICNRFAKTHKTYNIDVESDQDEVEDQDEDQDEVEDQDEAEADDDESVSLGSQDTSNSSAENLKRKKTNKIYFSTLAK